LKALNAHSIYWSLAKRFLSRWTSLQNM
jgi:hypothetical protein